MLCHPPQSRHHNLYPTPLLLTSVLCHPPQSRHHNLYPTPPASYLSVIPPLDCIIHHLPPAHWLLQAGQLGLSKSLVFLVDWFTCLFIPLCYTTFLIQDTIICIPHPLPLSSVLYQLPQSRHHNLYPTTPASYLSVIYHLPQSRHHNLFPTPLPLTLVLYQLPQSRHHNLYPTPRLSPQCYASFFNQDTIIFCNVFVKVRQEWNLHFSKATLL